MSALRTRGVVWIVGAAFSAAASYSVAQAPIIDASQPVSRSNSNSGNTSSSSAAPTAAGSPTGALYIQLQSLQQEVMELRGIVEEQRHQLDTLKQQSLERYTDLDRRLSQGGGTAVAVAAQPEPNIAPADSSANNDIAQPAAAATPTTAPPVATMQTAKPEEYEAYQKAYAKLKGQDFGGAIKAFNGFIETYPGSTLAGNAYYWLGKAYLQPPQDLNKAQQTFAKVVGDTPQHTKAPDALYELGKIAYLKGDKAKAKSLLQQVIDNYGTSGSTAPQLAKQFLDQNLRK
jgi:tol-pal system protein YbgF